MAQGPPLQSSTRSRNRLGVHHAGCFHRSGERAPFRRADENDQVIKITNEANDAANQD
jgi:hypothetical protein